MEFLEKKGKLTGHVLDLDWGKRAYIVFDNSMPLGKAEMIEEGNETQMEQTISNYH
jgi:hypothetical protein